MAREKPLFRDNLDRLDDAFPDKEVFAVSGHRKVSRKKLRYC